MIYDSGTIITFEDGDKSFDANLGYPSALDYIEVRVKVDETLFILANNHYRDTELWVIIAEFNAGQLDDIFNLEVGSLIKIPILS